MTVAEAEGAGRSAFLCPACGGHLPAASEQGDGAIVHVACRRCGRSYPSRHGIVDLRTEHPETCWTSALRLPEPELVHQMAEMYPDASMVDLIDVYSDAHDLPAR